MRTSMIVVALIFILLGGTSRGYSQDWSIGGNMGLSLLDGFAGFQLTPMAEIGFNQNMAIGSEFSINTQYGVPLYLYPYFKYYFGISGSNLRPYANAGPVMTLNVPGSPSFGILFGGGVSIPLAPNLYLAPDVLLGPVFGVGGGNVPFILRGYYWGYETYGLTSYSVSSTTVFAFSIRGGLRYEL